MNPETVSPTEWGKIDWTTVDLSKLDPTKINPKAVVRFIREKGVAAEFTAKTIRRQAGQWTREMIIEDLAELEKQPTFKVGEEEVRPGLNMHGADLSGLDLSGLDLRRINLHGAKLKGTKLAGADLRDANLCEAELDGAELTDAKLDRVNLSKACLCGCLFHGASMERCNLSDCCAGGGVSGLDYTVEEKTDSRVEKASRKGHGFSVSGNTLRTCGKNLSGSNLSGISETHKGR